MSKLHEVNGAQSLNVGMPMCLVTHDVAPVNCKNCTEKPQSPLADDACRLHGRYCAHTINKFFSSVRTRDPVQSSQFYLRRTLAIEDQKIVLFGDTVNKYEKTSAKIFPH